MSFSRGKAGLVVAILAMLALGGCASMQSAPISEQTTTVDTSKESIAFMTLKVANTKNASYQPNMKYAFVWDDKATDRKRYSFRMVAPYNSVANQYNEYVVSIKVKPGNYVVRELFGQSGLFPVMGTFNVPMYKKVSIPENKVLYLGHVDATVVDRKSDDQLRAGPVIPLIDQAVVGASNGTFLIDIKDRFSEDTALVKGKYPAFANVAIENMTLSQWQKPSAEEMK